MGEPEVRLSEDGRTVLVKYQEEGTLSSNLFSSNVIIKVVNLLPFFPVCKNHLNT